MKFLEHFVGTNSLLLFKEMLLKGKLHFPFFFFFLESSPGPESVELQHMKARGLGTTCSRSYPGGAFRGVGLGRTSVSLSTTHRSQALEVSPCRGGSWVFLSSALCLLPAVTQAVLHQSHPCPMQWHLSFLSRRHCGSGLIL